MTSKVKQGEVVEFGGVNYKVTSLSYVAHPELLGARASTKGKYFAQLFPVGKNDEEISGWVNVRRLKKIRR